MNYLNCFDRDNVDLQSVLLLYKMPLFLMSSNFGRWRGFAICAHLIKLTPR